MAVILVSGFQAATERLYDELAKRGAMTLQVSCGDVSARFHNVSPESADAWSEFIEAGGHGPRQLQMVATQISKQRGNVDLVMDGRLVIQATDKTPRFAEIQSVDEDSIDTQCNSDECRECNLQPLTVYLPPEQCVMLNQLASEAGVSESEFASQILTSAIDAMYCARVRREVADRRSASRVSIERARRLGKLRAFAVEKLTGILGSQRQPKLGLSIG